ncbi:MAG: ATP-binding protein, partial [Erysipelotrichaceae bacterium]|nr:ATP-binding protein [Erysipelotrichaceae bacterium]
MGKIHALDTQLTNMIAAGEVVERPSGIVKELVENSIDAGAKSIEVRCINGGIDSIEIIDDGCGMSFEDAAMAFERHATSKIKTTDDLWSIHTLGFRGEALPSIASVSKMELETCDGDEATRIVMEYGERKEYKVSPCNEGTSILIT